MSVIPSVWALEIMSILRAPWPRIELRTSEYKVQCVIHFFTPTALVNNILAYKAFMRRRGVIAIIKTTQNANIYMK